MSQLNNLNNGISTSSKRLSFPRTINTPVQSVHLTQYIKEPLKTPVFNEESVTTSVKQKTYILQNANEIFIYLQNNENNNSVFVDENSSKKLVKNLLESGLMFESKKGTYRQLK